MATARSALQLAAFTAQCCQPTALATCVLLCEGSTRHSAGRWLPGWVPQDVASQPGNGAGLGVLGGRQAQLRAQAGTSAWSWDADQEGHGQGQPGLEPSTPLVQGN